ncbi:NUDIX domain-containing protein [Candidatus Pacebacteria bacterium]|nr:NUDIX domain-containing protein [Candidatus Paceibacterota bacterium]
MKIIYKSAWIHVAERKLLFVRAKGNDTFYIPGGKKDEGETDEMALIREIQEELSVDLLRESIIFQKKFISPAHGKHEDTTLEMMCYFADFTGKPMPSNEIEQMTWYCHADRAKTSGARTAILDWLKEEDLID